MLLDELKPEKPGPAYLGPSPTDPEGPNYAETERAKLEEQRGEGYKKGIGRGDDDEAN